MNTYTNPYTCETHPVASCGTCHTPTPKPCDTCPKCPVLCPELCTQAKHGISQPRVGLQERYVVGLGNEDRVNTEGLIANTEFNSIPWYWLAESILDPEVAFTPKRYERCDGTYFEAPDRNTYIKKAPNGTIIKTWKNPFSTLNASAGLTINVTDSIPFLNENVFVNAGDPIKLRAGTGIDLTVQNDGTIEIINTSVIDPTVVQRVNNSGITLAGTGTSTNPYLIGIDCGTLRANCGLVKSVNGVTPDQNGNVNVSGGSSGITNILPDPANIVSFTPTSSGILQTNFSCQNLKNSCNLLDTSSLIPLSRIEQSGATTGQIPVWNGTNWVAQTPSGGSTTVQYQRNGTNTGSTNPTVVNFTGNGVNATQAGGVVTVNIPGGGAAALNQGLYVRFQADGNLFLSSANTSTAEKAATNVQVFYNPTPSLFTISGTTITFNQAGEYLLMASPTMRLRSSSTNATFYDLYTQVGYAIPNATGTMVPEQIGRPPNGANHQVIIPNGVTLDTAYSYSHVVSVSAGQTLENVRWGMFRNTGSPGGNAFIEMILFELNLGIYKLK